MASDLSPAPGGGQLDNRRVAAALIDLLLPAGAAVLVYALDVLTAATAAVIVGWALFYFFALESRDDSQTFGKHLMKLKVASVGGGRPSTGQIAVRTLLRVVDTPLIGPIVMVATKERRARLGDLAASTAVVDAGVVSGDETSDLRPQTSEEPEPGPDPLAGGFAEPVTPEPEPAPPEQEPEPEPEPEPEQEPDEELVVKPVETVSAIDLVMEADEADEEDGPEHPSL